MTEKDLREKIGKVLMLSPRAHVPCAMIGHEYNMWSPEKQTYHSRKWAIRALLIEFLKDKEEISRSLVSSYREYFDVFYVMTTELLLREKFAMEKERLRYDESMMIYIEGGYPEQSTGIRKQKVFGKKTDEMIRFLSADITEESKYELFKRCFFEDFVKCFLGNSQIDQTVYWYIEADLWKKVNERMPKMVNRLVAESKESGHKVSELNRKLNSMLMQMTQEEREKVVEIRVELGGKPIRIVD